MGSQEVKLIDGVIVWVGGFACEADGAPRAYHPDSASGLDKLANALHVTDEYETYVKLGQRPPHGWAGVACDPNGNPIVQDATPPPIVLPDGTPLPHRDHAPGFYVSTTAFADPRFPVGDPCRYIDASAVPYVKRGPHAKALGACMGDLAVLLNVFTSQWTWAIVGDAGSDSPEASIEACRRVGGPADPRGGGPSRDIVCAILVGSTGKWPRSDDPQAAIDEINSQVAARLQPWGGLDRLRSLSFK